MNSLQICVLLIIVVVAGIMIFNRNEQYVQYINGFVSAHRDATRNFTSGGVDSFTNHPLSYDVCRKAKPDLITLRAGCEDSMNWQRKTRGCDQFWCNWRTKD